VNELLESNADREFEIVEPGAEQPVRVISVPKTLKTPRIIAIEPVCMQYIQQALASTIVKSIEKHPLTAGRINFTDQSINRELALNGSKTRDIGTLDLSEASDRVSLDLVKRMLKSVPELLEPVLACRSTRANVPGHDTIDLRKFASMGSALCFPIEAMVFFTIALTAEILRLGTKCTPSAVRKAASGVYVYGDDIIVPRRQVPTTAFALTVLGLRVNLNKTFWRGSFRESCGMDAYNGVPVTPVYLRRMPPSGRQDVSLLPSFVSFANQLYKAGWWKTARRVREAVSDIFGDLPHVREESACLGWNSFLGTYSIHRYDQKLQRFEVKSFALKSQEYPDALTGYGALMKFFLERGPIEPLPLKSYSHSVRRGAVNIKRRWALPF
jgi:hypothetical protein